MLNIVFFIQSEMAFPSPASRIQTNLVIQVAAKYWPALSTCTFSHGHQNLLLSYLLNIGIDSSPALVSVPSRTRLRTRSLQPSAASSAS